MTKGNTGDERYESDRSVRIALAFYFLVAGLEIVAEYLRLVPMIYATKPLIIPPLIFVYCRTSPKINYTYIIALIFTWIASIFFIKQTFTSIFTGAIFFFFYRALIIYIVIKHIKLPGIFPMAVGCLPFLFIYIYVVNLTHKLLGDGLMIFIIQCVIVSLLGGLAVGNYVLKSDRAAIHLLLSTMLFAVTQFIFVIKLYYPMVNLFQPAAMTFYVVAQYMFYRFLLLTERERAARPATDEKALSA